MGNKFFWVIGLAFLFVVGGVTFYLLRPQEQASEPIQAIPVVTNTTAPHTVVEPTQEGVSPSPLDSEVITFPTADPTETVAVAPASTREPSQPLQALVIFRVAQDESKARFSIDEVLRNEPFTAVGETSQVAGEIAVDFQAGTVQLGTILVNARTLQTDNSFRDRAINNQILQTAQYEYIIFEPLAVIGLPTTAEVGQTYEFQIQGNLVIRDITKEVLFDARVTLVSMQRLEGYASGVIYRSDYQLTIPSVPSVASVEDDVLLEIEFVAIVDE